MDFFGADAEGLDATSASAAFGICSVVEAVDDEDDMVLLENVAKGPGKR